MHIKRDSDCNGNEKTTQRERGGGEGGREGEKERERERESFKAWNLVTVFFVNVGKKSCSSNNYFKRTRHRNCHAVAK